MIKKPTVPLDGLPLEIRPAINEDLNFIFNSWLKSFQNGMLVREVSSVIYFTEHHKVLQKIIPQSIVQIACSPEHPDQIYGYIVYQYIEGIYVLHYIYVKHTYRKFGVARALLAITGIDKEVANCYTHHNRIAERQAAKYNFVYHPYLLFNAPPQATANPETLKTPELDIESVENVRD